MASAVPSEPPPSATEDLPLDLDIWTEILDRLDAPDISHLARASKAASYLVSLTPDVRRSALMCAGEGRCRRMAVVDAEVSLAPRDG
jgi:hypothetical protein